LIAVTVSTGGGSFKPKIPGNRQAKFLRLNSLLVGVNVVHKIFDLVAVAEAGFFLALFEPRAGGFVVRERTAEDIGPMRSFFGGGF